jgi:transglutaminase-like putative cysteine protease
VSDVISVPDPDSTGALRRVGCDLTFEVTDEALVALQVAVATTAGTIVAEEFAALDGSGRALEPVEELRDEHGGRIHLVSAPPGRLSIRYDASLWPATGAPDPNAPDPAHHVEPVDSVVALRQSRYCPSDALAGFAAVEFPDAAARAPYEIALEVASWVFERFAYVPGSTGPLDTAVDFLVSGAGVCRDYAHLTLSLCRALGVPARLAAVYAPGLLPMDFHAVVEVLTPDGWQVVDPTRLAPRPTLVRIATGRDAADTAFATTLRGAAELTESLVRANTAGRLPLDDHTSLLSLA